MRLYMKFSKKYHLWHCRPRDAWIGLNVTSRLCGNDMLYNLLRSRNDGREERCLLNFVNRYSLKSL
jgi:hypothetical protein